MSMPRRLSLSALNILAGASDCRHHVNAYWRGKNAQRVEEDQMSNLTERIREGAQALLEKAADLQVEGVRVYRIA
jgi:hypothetical protein